MANLGGKVKRGKIKKTISKKIFSRILYLIDDIRYDVTNNFYSLAEDPCIELLTIINNENKSKAED